MKRLILVALMGGAFVLLPAAAAAATDTELVYADGQTYQMVGATLVTNASPGLLRSPPLYVLGFPASGTTPITLPSGYQPQCNPCLQEPVAYHDHLITGAPGLGTSGTAGGDYMAPWRIVVMVYTHAYAYSANFQPVTSDEQLAAAEAAGEFAVINPGAPDPHQIWMNNVLICPVVMQQAG
jgi:hypothetical protein